MRRDPDVDLLKSLLQDFLVVSQERRAHRIVRVDADAQQLVAIAPTYLHIPMMRTVSSVIPPKRSLNSSAVWYSFSGSISVPSLWFNGKRISNLLVRAGRRRSRKNRVMNLMLIQEFQVALTDLEDPPAEDPHDGLRRQEVVALDAILIGGESDSDHSAPRRLSTACSPQL